MNDWKRLCSSTELHLEKTFNSDQTHLWKPGSENNKWNGVIGGFLISLKEEEGNNLHFDDKLYHN